MNPEIRFRVPKHVHQLAHTRAAELGLESKRGKTGGASELARGALYTFLGLGLPEELGDACAFLCSAQSGFISGQNVQLDGGSYDGLL